MKRSQALLITSATCLLGGCAATQESATQMASVSLGQLSPMASSETPVRRCRLGAGDALGYEIFAYYVAHVESKRQFAAAGSASIDQ